MVSSVLRRVVAVSSMAMLGGFLAQPAEAFAAKEPVGLNLERDHQVAGRAPVAARRALASKPDPES